MNMLYHRVRLQILAAVAVASFQISCSSQNSGSRSNVQIHIPSVSQLTSSSKTVGALTTPAYDWSLACFIINVSAIDITSSKPDTCDINFGIAAGSAAPNTDLTLNLPSGKSRSADVFVYKRKLSTEACPPASKTFAGLDHSRLVRVGSLSSFDSLLAEVSVSIEVSAPTVGTSILSQYSLPSSCGPQFKIKNTLISAVRVQSDGTANKLRGTGSALPPQTTKSSSLKLKNSGITF